jgi:hypothetical protein
MMLQTVPLRWGPRKIVFDAIKTGRHLPRPVDIQTPQNDADELGEMAGLPFFENWTSQPFCAGQSSHMDSKTWQKQKGSAARRVTRRRAWLAPKNRRPCLRWLFRVRVGAEPQ